MELFFDTETSDMFKFNESYKSKHQPWPVQLGMILAEEDMTYARLDIMVQPDDRKINPHAFSVHGISEEMAQKGGQPEAFICEMFLYYMESADTLVCHNTDFDISIMAASMHRTGASEDTINELLNKPRFCTMKKGTDLCKLPGRYGSYKWPKLQELYLFLFGEQFEHAHDAFADIQATRRCYYEMIRRERETEDVEPIQEEGAL